MGRYLIDNNAISSFFSESLSEVGMEFLAEVFDKTPWISVITQIEALSWVSGDKAKDAIIKEFISDATILDLDQDIITRCVRLRRSRKIKTPDAIIAATAIVYNLTLITNDKGFDNIPELNVIDPYSI